MTQVSAHVDQVLAEVDRRTELLIALLRALILLVLAALFWWPGGLERNPATMFPLLGLAVVTGARALVVVAGLFRPWMAWLSTTLDVLFLNHCLLMAAEMAGQSFGGALAMPTASAIYLFLATTAVRHRPMLVLYTGGLFVSVWAGVWLLDGRAVLGVGALDEGPAAFDADAVGTLARLTIVVLTALALSLAITRARTALIKSVTEARLRANLARYFSPGIVEDLAHAGDAARAFRQQKVAILFADIRGFTALAEATPTADVAMLLTEYRALVGDVVNRHGGTIDKFIGDAVMAVFGVPHATRHDASNAARAAVALLSATDTWNAGRAERRLPPVEIGIGVHYGDVLAGALGDDNRLEYTVIGDTVNTAQRIERLTAALGTRLLLSTELLDAAAGAAEVGQWEALPPERLRGRRRAIQLYRWLGDEPTRKTADHELRSRLQVGGEGSIPRVPAGRSS